MDYRHSKIIGFPYHYILLHQLPDVFINLDFKTELVAQLKKLNPGITIKLVLQLNIRKNLVNSILSNLSLVQVQKSQIMVIIINQVLSVSNKDCPPVVKILKDQEGFLVKLIIVNITIEEQQEKLLLPHRLHQGIINQHQLLIQVIWLNRHIQYHSNHSNHSNTNHNSHNNKHHIQLNHQSHLLTRINPVNLKERYHHQHQAYKFLQHKLHLGNRQHSKDKHQLITQLRLQIDLLLQPLLLLLVIQVDQLKTAPAPPVKKTAPPPPPPTLVKPKFPTYKAMFDYDGSVAGSIPLVKDTIYYVTQVNGKWGLVKTMDETKEGWSPIDYLKECSPNETQNPHHLHHLLLQQQQHLQGLTELLIQLVQPPVQTLLLALIQQTQL